MTKRLPATLTMLLFTVGLAAQATKNVTSRDGSCQIAVPSAWTVDTMLATATSADKKVSVTVSSPKMIDSFAELKSNAKMVYAASKAVKDTATEFQMEGKSIAGKPDVYRAVPIAGAKFCIAEVTYESGTIDAAREIAVSLKAAK